MNNIYVQVFVPALVSMVGVFWVFFKILKIAKVKNIVDNPDARKLQKVPVPVLGGIAVFFGLLCGALAMVSIHQVGGLLPVVLAMGVMLYMGAMDDMLGLTPISRLLVEILTMLAIIYGTGMCVDNLHGVWGVREMTWTVGVPLTVFAGVGIINAMNMIDGVNGLSSGLCITCCAVFGTAFLMSGDVMNATLGYAMAAALIPFLLHNVFGNTSRMFIGDAGTMTMGVLMSWFMINVLSGKSVTSWAHQGDMVGMVAMTMAILSVPVFDTLRVMNQRIMKGKSPFSADKTHLHHVFIAVGFSHYITALSEILIDVMVVAIWCVSCKVLHLNVTMQMYVVLVSAMVLVWGTYAFLHYQDKHQTKLLEVMKRKTKKTHLGNTRWWKKWQRWLDAPEFEEDEKAKMHHRNWMHFKFGNHEQKN